MTHELSTFTRTFETGLDFLSRANGGDNRTVYGYLIPFGRETAVHDYGYEYTESIKPGATKRSINARAGKLKLLAQHNERLLPLANASVLREDEQGLYGEFRMPHTTAGNDALELIREGVIGGFSIRFAPVQPGAHYMPKPGEHVARKEIALIEVSLVGEPAYQDALVAVREQQAIEPVKNLTQISEVEQWLVTRGIR